MKVSAYKVKQELPRLVLTIGHSTRSSEEFIRLLAAHQVQRVIDVRTLPRSRHNPQFNRSELSSALQSPKNHVEKTYHVKIRGTMRPRSNAPSRSSSAYCRRWTIRSTTKARAPRLRSSAPTRNSCARTGAGPARRRAAMRP